MSAEESSFGHQQRKYIRFRFQPQCRGRNFESGTEEKERRFNLLSVEATIPPGKAKNPFGPMGLICWVTRWVQDGHALLPFNDPGSPRRTGLIRSSLSFNHTHALLQACTKAKASLYGALSAAGLKSAAAVKNLGNRSEHYAIISLVECRKYLEPSISDSTVDVRTLSNINTVRAWYLPDGALLWESRIEATPGFNLGLISLPVDVDGNKVNDLLFYSGSIVTAISGA